MSDPIFSTDEGERLVLKRVRVRLITLEVERARWDALSRKESNGLWGEHPIDKGGVRIE